MLSLVDVGRRLSALQPEDARALDRLLDVTWETVDPVRLELCRIRLAMLMGDVDAAAHRNPRAVAAGLDERKVQEMDSWFESSAFDDADRAVLTFAEQFNLSVADVRMEEIDGLRTYLPDADLASFCAAIYAVELDLRLRMVARQVLTPEGAE